MSCPLRMDTGAHALGVLSPDDRTRMALHLEGCRTCRSDVAEFTTMLRSLRSVVAHMSGTAERDDPGRRM